MSLCWRITACRRRSGLALSGRWYDLDCCQKYGLSPTARPSFAAFDGKLRENKPSDDQRRQARRVIAPSITVQARGQVLPSSILWRGRQVGLGASAHFQAADLAQHGEPFQAVLSFAIDRLAPIAA